MTLAPPSSARRMRLPGDGCGTPDAQAGPPAVIPHDPSARIPRLAPGAIPPPGRGPFAFGARQVLSPDVTHAVGLPCLPALPVDGPFLLPLERLHELR